MLHDPTTTTPPAPTGLSASCATQVATRSAYAAEGDVIPMHGSSFQGKAGPGQRRTHRQGRVVVTAPVVVAHHIVVSDHVGGGPE